MNRIGWMFALLVGAWVVSSCSSSSTPAPSSTLPTAAEALSTEDTKSGGIYKGAIIGSSGVFTVRLQKGVKQVVITLDGTSKTLTTTGLTAWVSGDPIKNAIFTADDWTATFSVGASGGVPNLTLTIPGHASAQVVIFKELSNSIVTVFEGTYSGTSTGTWNFAIQGEAIVGKSLSTDGSSLLNFFGLVIGNSITLDNITGSGTISGDNASGSWQTSSPAGSGTWKGKRIL